VNKLAVIIPFYQREEITSLCFEQISKQSRKYNFDVYCVGNNDELPLKYGLNYVFAVNNPVSNKINKAYETIKDKYDGVIGMGSDNFLSDSIWEMYLKMDLSGAFFTGFTDIHIYSVWHNILAHNFSYTKNGNLIAVGRLITRAALELVNYTPYECNINKGLDSSNRKLLLSKGAKEVAIDYKGHFILDVKHEKNISSPDIVFSGEVDSLKKLPNFVKLLEKKTVKQITHKIEKGNKIEKRKKMEKGNKIAVKYLVDASGVLAGTVKKLPSSTARDIVNLGVAEYYQEEEVVVVPTKKTRAKK
jgi:hypothetical protein